jgi:hydrogenase maturation protease
MRGQPDHPYRTALRDPNPKSATLPRIRWRHSAGSSSLALPSFPAYSRRVNQSHAKGPAREVLVIGCGNELRGDDGVGLQVAAAVEQLSLPAVRVIACHQLTPELAEAISQARLTVFVDAAVDGGSGPELRELKPAAGGALLAHVADPGALLALARDVFGRCPAAWWLTIPIADTGFGKPLSPLAERGLRFAVDRIRALAAGD